MNKNHAHKIIFLSDLHLVENKKTNLNDCNTLERLKKINNHLLASEPNIDAIILMGDLSQDGSILSYQHLLNELKIFSCPIYSIPGNHDEINNWQQAFDNSIISTVKHFELFGWNFLGLNTVIEGENSGWMSENELQWLDKKLNELSDEKIILLMHHHPISFSKPLIDKYILKNANEFFEIIKNKNNIHLVIFGHVHNVVEIIYNKITFLSCPSTCFQFIAEIEKIKLNKEEIGYRWLAIEDDKLLSGVKMLNVK